MLRLRSRITQLLHDEGVKKSIVVHVVSGENAIISECNIHFFVSPTVTDDVILSSFRAAKSKRRVPISPSWKNNSCALDCISVFVCNCYDDKWGIAFNKLPMDKPQELREVIEDVSSKKGKMCVYDAYSKLASLSTEAEFVIPVTSFSWKEKQDMFQPKHYTEKTACCSFWEFLESPDPKFGKRAKIIQWDMCASDFLVFFNGGNPRVTDVSSNENARKFGMTILDGRYILRGAIILTGVPKKGEGGEHYICLYQNTEREWRRYDSLDGTSHVEENVENILFSEVEENSGTVSIPAMYFYARVPSLPREETGSTLSLHKGQIRKEIYYNDGSKETIHDGEEKMIFYDE